MEQTNTLELFKKVEEVFNELNSVKQTAIKCGISEVKARRILITLGLWSSRRSDLIKKYFDMGYSALQISKEIGSDVKTVEAYMPYHRCVYGGDEKSDEATRSELYRDRQKNAVDGMVQHNKADCAESNRGKLLFSKSDEKEVISDRDDFAYEKRAVYLLHLELEGTSSSDLKKISSNTSDFHRLAKVEQSISRDILVPGDMNLHALHYAIQKLFGWQNGHLHNFALTQEDFQLVTDEKMDTYCDLCGSLFRFPDDDTSDLYWDDDYQEGISVKSWLKKKYSHPYQSLSVGDTVIGNQMKKGIFAQQYPQLMGNTLLADMIQKSGIEQDMNCLSERLAIRDLFLKPKSERIDLRKWKGDILGKLQGLQKKWDLAQQKSVLEAIEQLHLWRNDYDWCKREIWLHPDETRQYIREKRGMTVDKLIETQKDAIEGWTETLHEVFTTLNITPIPYFKTIRYAYDYGDNWQVGITVKEVYDAKTGETYESVRDILVSGLSEEENTRIREENEASGVEIIDDDDWLQGSWTCFSAMNDQQAKERYRYFGSGGNEVDEELRRKLAGVHVDKVPLCVASDGLNVVEDSGGVYGFLDMLRKIYGNDWKQSDQARTLANNLGWTGRRTRPENML